MFWKVEGCLVGSRSLRSAAPPPPLPTPPPRRKCQGRKAPISDRRAVLLCSWCAVSAHTNTHAPGRSQMYYTHINNLSAVTQREGPFMLRSVAARRGTEWRWTQWYEWENAQNCRLIQYFQTDADSSGVPLFFFFTLICLCYLWWIERREIVFSKGSTTECHCNNKKICCCSSQPRLTDIIGLCFLTHFDDLCDCVWNTMCDKTLGKCTHGKCLWYWTKAGGWNCLFFYTHIHTFTHPWTHTHIYWFYTLRRKLHFIFLNFIA